MLTAAVRDLHRNYPDGFVTDVRTSCPQLWESNPYLSALDEEDSDVKGSVLNIDTGLVTGNVGACHASCESNIRGRSIT